MDKDWAKTKLTFEDETWAFRNSEKAISKLWAKNKRLVNSATKKTMTENENVIKNMLMVDAFMEGYKQGRIN